MRQRGIRQTASFMGSRNTNTLHNLFVPELQMLAFFGSLFTLKLNLCCEATTDSSFRVANANHPTCGRLDEKILDT